jgi:hypothetical protein
LAAPDGSAAAVVVFDVFSGSLQIYQYLLSTRQTRLISTAKAEATDACFRVLDKDGIWHWWPCSLDQVHPHNPCRRLRVWCFGGRTRSRRDLRETGARAFNGTPFDQRFVINNFMNP